MKITNTCKIFETLFFKNQKWNQTETAFRRQRLNIFYAFILRMFTYCIQTDSNVYIYIVCFASVYFAHLVLQLRNLLGLYN